MRRPAGVPVAPVDSPSAGFFAAGFFAAGFFAAAFFAAGFLAAGFLAAVSYTHLTLPTTPYV